MLMQADDSFVLAIDRDRSYSNSLEFAFRAEGYSYSHFNDYQSAQSYLFAPGCQAVVISRNLDGASGLQLAKILRSELATSRLAIILVSHAYDDFDVVESLESGVDDYLVKPLGPREVVYRFKAIMGRRSKSGGAEKRESESVRNSIGPLFLSNEKSVAVVDGQVLKLTPTEFKILQCLVQSPDRVLSRMQLMAKVSSEDLCDAQARKIDVHVGRIRSELMKYKMSPLIQTVRGEGYLIRLQS